MRKQDELTNPNACMVRARDNEMTFVLLGRDAAAPVAIRAWIEERIRLGKNTPDDPQIVEAEECAKTMEAERLSPAENKAKGGLAVDVNVANSLIDRILAFRDNIDKVETSAFLSAWEFNPFSDPDGEQLMKDFREIAQIAEALKAG